MFTQEEVMQERSKHQRYVNKKTEEMRALMQEVYGWTDSCFYVLLHVCMLFSWGNCDRLSGPYDQGLKT